MKHWSASIVALLLAAVVGMTSCKNGNLFGRLHKSGDSSNPAILTSDASLALRDRDYSRALDLYQKVLDQNPNDSNALYGAASASLGSSGLNLSVLITNLLTQTDGAPSVSNIGQLIRASRVSTGPSKTTDPNSLLAGIDIAKLSEHIPTVKCYLHRIVSGQADGKISPKSPNVLLNYAVVLVLDAAVAALNADIVDIVNDGGTYTITKGSNGTPCSDSELVLRIGRDLAVGYRALNTVVAQLNLVPGKIVPELQSDVSNILALLLDPIAHPSTALPSECLSTLSNDGINKDTFTSYTGDVSC